MGRDQIRKILEIHPDLETAHPDDRNGAVSREIKAFILNREWPADISGTWAIRDLLRMTSGGMSLAELHELDDSRMSRFVELGTLAVLRQHIARPEGSKIARGLEPEMGREA